MKAKMPLSATLPGSQKAFFSFLLTSAGESIKSIFESSSEEDIFDPVRPGTEQTEGVGGEGGRGVEKEERCEREDGKHKCLDLLKSIEFEMISFGRKAKGEGWNGKKRSGFRGLHRN